MNKMERIARRATISWLTEGGLEQLRQFIQDEIAAQSVPRRDVYQEVWKQFRSVFHGFADKMGDSDKRKFDAAWSKFRDYLETTSEQETIV